MDLVAIQNIKEQKEINLLAFYSTLLKKAGGVARYICPHRAPKTLKPWGKAVSKRSVLMLSALNFDSALLLVKVSSTDLIS